MLRPHYALNSNGHMKQLKGSIHIISSRVNCIKKCLESLWNNYNSNHNYPVYVFYFDDIYDSLDLQKDIIGDTGQNVVFKSVPYKTPDFIPESELYYNRKDIQYVNTSFSINRKGYLHMCNFKSNMYGYENTELENYDFIMILDDESGYLKMMDYDPFDIIAESGALFGAYLCGQRLYNGKPHQGHLDTRNGLYQFTKNFIDSNKIIPKSESLIEIMKYPNPEEKFHFLNWADTYVINTSIFKTDNWKLWINAVNKSGGVYKYRWGDNEIYSLYAHIFIGTIYNLKTVDDGYHDQGMFRSLCDLAPNVKNIIK